MSKALRARRLGPYSFGFLAALLVVSGGLLAGLACLSLDGSRSDVGSETLWLGADGKTPALHLRPPVVPGAPASAPSGALAAPPTGSRGAGTVVVAHGFAGSKEYLRDLDYSLARAGFEVYGVDLPGHGHSGLRLDQARLSIWFSDLLRSLAETGRLQPGRVYLVGHSLGALVVTKGALRNPDLGVRAVVVLSPVFYDGITTTQPANYLALTAASELPGVREAAGQALARATGLPDAALETVYGDHVTGTARSAGTVQGATHASIVDSESAIGRTVLWLLHSAGLPAGDLPRLESEGAERGFGLVGAGLFTLGLFFLAAGALGWLGHAPRRPEARSTADREKATRLFAGTRLIPIIFALATVVAVAVPGFLGTFVFLRQAVVDYLGLFFLVLTALAVPLVLLAGRYLRTGPLLSPRLVVGVGPSLLLGLGLFGLTLVTVGGFGTYAWASLWPPAGRWTQILLLAALFAPFAALDEMVRGTVHDRTGSLWALTVTVMGKLMMAVGWYGAALLPRPPQALLVALPYVVGILIALDLVATLTYREHGSWLASAVFKTLTLAWLVGTVFPVLGGAMRF